LSDSADRSPTQSIRAESVRAVRLTRRFSSWSSSTAVESPAEAERAPAVTSRVPDRVWSSSLRTGTMSRFPIRSDFCEGRSILKQIKNHSASFSSPLRERSRSIAATERLFLKPALARCLRWNALVDALSRDPRPVGLRTGSYSNRATFAIAPGVGLIGNLRWPVPESSPPVQSFWLRFTPVCSAQPRDVCGTCFALPTFSPCAYGSSSIYMSLAGMSEGLIGRLPVLDIRSGLASSLRICQPGFSRRPSPFFTASAFRHPGYHTPLPIPDRITAPLEEPLFAHLSIYERGL